MACPQQQLFQPMPYSTNSLPSEQEAKWNELIIELTNLNKYIYINRLPLVNSQYIYIFIHWEESCGWMAAIPMSQRETIVSQLHEK